MTEKQRKKIRDGISKLGFYPNYDWDLPTMVDGGDGIFTEYYETGMDRTRIIIEWDERQE